MQKHSSLFLVVLIFYLLHPIFLSGQQLPTYTQFRSLQNTFNPSVIPIDYFVYSNEHKLFVAATHRDQWSSTNLQSPPRTTILSVDFIPEEIEYGGLFGGGYLLQDRSGVFETIGIYGKLAGVINVGIGELSVGLNIGVVQNQLRFRQPVPTPPNNFEGIFPDVGGGIFYRQDFRKQGFFYTGISVPQVFGLNNNFSPLFTVKRVPHYYYTAGLLHFFNENSFMEPYLLVKYVSGVPISVDLNIRAQLNDHFWIGAGYSLRGIFHLNIGVLKKWDKMLIKFGFGFSVITKAFGPQLGGSPEYHLSAAF